MAAIIIVIIALQVFIIITQATVHGGDGELFTANLIHRDYSSLSPYYNPSATHEDRIFAALNRSIAQSLDKPISIAPSILQQARIYTIRFGYIHKCQFGTFYGGGGFSTGDLVTDTFSIGSGDIPGINFGCGHDNGGPFWSTASGILGLGANSLSLVKQLQNLTNGRFAHCFAKHHHRTTTATETTNMGKIKFGENSFSDDKPGVVSTPFSVGTNYHYTLTLEDVTVGNSSKSIQPRSSGAGEGANIIIDSGATYTHLPNGIYEKLERDIIKNARNLKRIDDPSQGGFNLCFKNNFSYKKFSPITFHFSGGGDVVVRPKRFFVKVHDLICLNIFPVYEGGIAIFGNSLQIYTTSF
ncbi:probable aspartic protease At2g35615 [Impatiens glandulifera]|uniref:probable aspartic protease At2g35615 n=1 Tax=Impatiens glandulifera TaxID=253017 RepID=UPI001FB05AD7|nr:probable aspartic protease At2g35615 [Impatiens glandulifera]